MALIDARKRMDVTGLDIGEQPESDYILLYNETPFAINQYEVDEHGTLTGYHAGRKVVAFNARRATWLVIRRDVAKLATKEEIAAASADLQKLQEEMFARFHPDEYAAYQKARRQQLGLGSGRDPGQYV